MCMSYEYIMVFCVLRCVVYVCVHAQGMKDVECYQHVEVNELAKMEALNLLEYYRCKRWINKGES